MNAELFPEVRYRQACNCGFMYAWSRKKGWLREVQLSSSGSDGGIHRWGKGEECWAK